MWWDLLRYKPVFRISDKTPDSDRDSVDPAEYRWKNALLVSLIESQAYWCEGKNVFNEPVAPFVRAENEPATKLPISSANTWLVGNMPIADTSGIDAGVYDAFMESKRYYRACYATQRSPEKGYLYPTRPDPKTLLELLCGWP